MKVLVHGKSVDVSNALSFQDRVAPWTHACFGVDISIDVTERLDRLIEEVFEIAQALGYDQNRIAFLEKYVFARPAGNPSQELGGVMVTLAALCNATGLDMATAGETELERVWTKIDVIRAKQAAKPKHSPLPQ